MATEERREALSGKKLLDFIRATVSFARKGEVPLFRTPALVEVGKELREELDQDKMSDPEWLNLRNSAEVSGGNVEVCVLRNEVYKFEHDLQGLERAQAAHSLIQRNDVLQELIMLGQKLLRRKYLALLMHRGKKVTLSRAAAMIIDTGAAAIQVLGRAPSGPRCRYRKFNSSDFPRANALGIEILSSGAFPDWSDRSLVSLKRNGTIGRVGFENVIEASLDTPRAYALAKLYESGMEPSPRLFPMYQRLMLDLELMRLGQATTPGTYDMLLDSFYHGALFVDHSTNVSEQVQIIYEEENWKPAYQVKADLDPKVQALEAAAFLLGGYFRSKNNSLIHKDHPREARISVPETIDAATVRDFFQFLNTYLTKGMKTKTGRLPGIAPVHTVVPVVNLDRVPISIDTAKRLVDEMKSAGMRECYLTSDTTRHEAGLLQYFATAKDTNAALAYAKKCRVKLKNGRTVDLVATANKAIEAAAGAIESGQGCIKVGLLGLTCEEMREFVRRVKRGLRSGYRREENQLLVFIAIVDRPIVTEERVFTKAHDVAKHFIDLMRRTRHDILLIDTMDKGATDPRLVDAQDEKGGHMAVQQLRGLVRRAHSVECDLWVAGSYTEEQVYQASLDAPNERPGLICLGGAERSFGGLRLDPNEAYSPMRNSREEAEIAARVECDANIKYMLSRDNKLARDTGHVVGELRRRGRKAWIELDRMRTNYLGVRKRYFVLLEEAAVAAKLETRNIDTLDSKGDELFDGLQRSRIKAIEENKRRFERTRKKLVESVGNEMTTLFKEDWFAPRA